MTDHLQDRLRAHYTALGQQPMPEALENRLLQRRRREPVEQRWRGLVIGLATAAAVFAIIAVPLVTRLQSTPNPANSGTLGAIRTQFAKLVTTDSAALNGALANAQRACAVSATGGQETTACVTAARRLSGELLDINTDFNAVTVPGGVAAEMAQLVQALAAFATAASSGQSTSATTVMADAAAVETDLGALQHALTAV